MGQKEARLWVTNVDGGDGFLQGGGVKSSGGYVGAAVLWLVCLLALAAPAAGANTVSITSTPANGIAYVAGRDHHHAVQLPPQAQNRRRERPGSATPK